MAVASSVGRVPVAAKHCNGKMPVFQKINVYFLGTMDNREIAKIFHDIADLLDIKRENPFRIRSYRNAAHTIEGLAISLESIVEADEKKLEDIPGIGKSMHEKIVELVRTGRCAAREELLKEIPSGLLDILNISGVGHKKAELLYKELGIKDVPGLEEAAREGRLRGLPGMGAQSEAKLIKAIESYKRLKSGGARHKISSALRYAENYLKYMKESPEVIRVETAGSLRRWKETIGDIDILATRGKSGTAAIIERFVDYSEVAEVIAKGGTKVSVRLRNGLQADLRVVEEKSFGAALQYFTGSKTHNVALRERAGKMGLKLS
ncbi:MAG: nucleotidyltransferase domain-containing protein, partial [Thermodesulfobacteriota bacterium]